MQGREMAPAGYIRDEFGPPVTRIRPSRVPGPPLEQKLDRLRYVYLAARYPSLRGSRLRVGPNAHVRLGRDGRLAIGSAFRARHDLTLIAQGSLHIGHRVFCNRGVAIVALEQITIGDYVSIGERTSVLDHNHVIEPLDDIEGRRYEYDTAPVTIGNRVLISANCLILAGVTIGDDVVVAGGSVVTRSIPSGALAMGAPARVTRQLRTQ